MSKLYDRYVSLKKKDDSKLYLFKVGIFYVFLDDDAKRVSDVTNLKLTKLNDSYVKCGFPCSSSFKYLELFKRINLDVCMVEDDVSGDFLNVDLIISKLKKIDVDKITPVKAFNILCELKDML